MRDMKASSQDVAAPEAPLPLHWQGRLASLLEVLGVFVVGSLIARQVSRGLALGPANLRALGPGVPPEFVQLSVSAGANLVLRYGLMLGLAFAIGWWHRRRRLAAYGVTTAGRPARQHLGIGVLLFATVGILPILLKLLAGVLPMGPAPQHWALIESLHTPGVWLYLFVGSFGLVPIAEELLARGYVQTRLAEDFGPAPAILITAVFFTFSHTQYFIAGVLGAGMLAALLISSIAAGYVRHRTGSLLPVIIAHGLGNLPFRGWFEPTILGVLVFVVALRAGPIYRYVVQLWREVMVQKAVTAAGTGCIALAVVLALIMLAPALLPLFGALALGAALLLEFREKRSDWALQPTGIARG
jgi:membrane protease YdiL (CAAX protease family)